VVAKGEWSLKRVVAKRQLTVVCFLNGCSIQEHWKVNHLILLFSVMSNISYV